jgi:hypothetical protein
VRRRSFLGANLQLSRAEKRTWHGWLRANGKMVKDLGFKESPNGRQVCICSLISDKELS